MSFGGRTVPGQRFHTAAPSRPAPSTFASRQVPGSFGGRSVAPTSSRVNMPRVPVAMPARHGPMPTLVGAPRIPVVAPGPSFSAPVYPHRQPVYMQPTYVQHQQPYAVAGSRTYQVRKLSCWQRFVNFLKCIFCCKC